MSGRASRAFCLFFLAAETAAFLTAGFFGRAPAWGMFSRMERAAFTVEDSAGRAVDLRAYVPPVFYFANPDVLVEAAECACAKAPGGTPWTLRVPARGITKALCPR